MTPDLVRIATLHSRLQVTLTIVLLTLAVWGMIAALRNGAGQGYAAGLSIANLLILAECLLGIILLFGEAMRSVPALHIVYGVVMAAALPAVSRYNRQYPPRRRAWIFAATCLVLAGMAIRAVATGNM